MMATALTIAQQRELADELLEVLTRGGEIVRALGDPALISYTAAEFEGRDGGWLGDFTRDKVAEFRAGLGRDDEGACQDFEAWPDHLARVGVESSRCRSCGVYWREHPGTTGPDAIIDTPAGRMIVEWKTSADRGHA